MAEEKFLVLINNLLASGEIPDLFTDDEVENIVTMVRNEVKGAGIQDSRENCWKFFIDRVRKQLKVSFSSLLLSHKSTISVICDIIYYITDFYNITCEVIGDYFLLYYSKCNQVYL